MSSFCKSSEYRFYKFSTLFRPLTIFYIIVWNFGIWTHGNDLINGLDEKPWYFKDGKRYPEPATISNVTGIRNAKLLPYEDIGNDRILNQLMFVPPNYDLIKKSGKFKTILLYNAPNWWEYSEGDDLFKNLECPVDTCQITLDKNKRRTADMVLFHDHYVHANIKRKSHQIYAISHSESPFHTVPFKYPDVFNWTITYRHDSTIAAPYSKWVYYNPKIKRQNQHKNYAANKTKKIAWFVSNCFAKNARYSYAKELQKYIQVDIYGRCGNLKCSRSEEKKCYEMLYKNYKFYLAFENSNCKDYITEKFFVNGLQHDVIPVVMGASPLDYEKFAPLQSNIHVDHFESPKELAKYLHILDRNDELYNSYFKWKGTGEFLLTKFWCRICAMLHDDHAISTKHWYKNINHWWRSPGTCKNARSLLFELIKFINI